MFIIYLYKNENHTVETNLNNQGIDTNNFSIQKRKTRTRRRFVCLIAWGLTPPQQYFSYIAGISFTGGGSRSSRRKPPTLGR